MTMTNVMMRMIIMKKDDDVDKTMMYGKTDHILMVMKC